MESRKGFTLIELMVVILIVGILASVAVPMLRGRIDAAKWSEGKAMIGSIATAIRSYNAEKGPTGAVPTTLFMGATGLGFAAGDLVVSNGHHAEVVRVPKNLAAKVPDGVDPDAATTLSNMPSPPRATRSTNGASQSFIRHTFDPSRNALSVHPLP